MPESQIDKIKQVVFKPKEHTKLTEPDKKMVESPHLPHNRPLVNSDK